jgi:succinate-acetate transporter protein
MNIKMGLTWNGKALVTTVLFRLIFGGYVVAMDQYSFNDTNSALTVLAIFLLLGIFTTLFLFDKKIGLFGVIGLESVFLVLNAVFLILALGGMTDAGLHDPVANWWATVLRFVFSILTLVFALMAYRETRKKDLYYKP